MHRTSASRRAFHLWSIPAAIMLAATAVLALALPAFAQAGGPFNIGTPGTITSVDSAVDSTGATSVVYASGGIIYYLKGSAGTPEVVDDPTPIATDSNPAIAIGPDNLPQVVFAASDGQYYTKRSAGGVWSAPTLIAGIPVGGNPDIAVDGANAPWIVYAEDVDADPYAEISYTTGTFAASTLLWDGLLDAPTALGTFYSNPHIALDSAGKYHIIAAHEAVSGAPAVSTFNIIYDNNVGPGASFESPLRTSAVALSQNPIVIAPSAGVAGAGSPRVVYAQAGTAYSATLGSSWAEAVLGAFTQVAVGADNALVAVAYNTGGNINYAVDGGAGFGIGTLVAAGTNPSFVLSSTALSAYYLTGTGAAVQVTLRTFAYPSVPPAVTTPPANQPVIYGNNAVFTAVATGLPLPTVQWQVLTTAPGAVWTNIAGATTTTLTVTKPAVATSGYQYRAVFTNSGGPATSAAALLTVTARPITVTATAATKIYGAVDPALAYTITGGTLAPGETTLAGAVTRVAGENVGTYSVGVGTLLTANPNYAITFFSANFTITGKPITVTAVASTKVYDGTTTSTGVPTIAPALVAGDTGTFIQTYTTATVGIAKVLTPSGTITKNAVNVTANYTITFTPVATGVITQATPVITWPTPADLPIAGVLDAARLNAAASVPGSFVYTVTIPPAAPFTPTLPYTFATGGTYLLGTTFTPTDTVNYATATASVSLNVINGLATPVITWANPAPITYGTALGATQLNATVAGVPGTFAYTPAAGTVLAAGTRTLTVTFTPTNPALYNNAAAIVTITVNKATPVITWANPTNITYGTLLSATQLNATANVPGTFVYTPIAGTRLNAGAGQALSVAFTPTDTLNYNTTTGAAAITVVKATPVVTWTNPADIVVGTALGATQLNATASVPGAFVYTPASGTVLALGPAQALSVNFTPTDTVNYNNVTATAAINVTLPKPTITLTSSANPAADATTQIILTATVVGTPAPTGTVTFRDGAAVIGTPVAIVSNHASVTVSFAAGTSHNITATYNGNANYASVISAVLTQTVTAPPPPPGGGGGGGGGGFGSQLIGINLAGTSPFMDGNGKSITAGAISTPDGKLTLTVPVGVFIWNAAGAAQPFLSANAVDAPPAAPAQQKIVKAFDMGTTGVTFNPGISMTFNYTAADITGLSESGLYIAWWDGSAWVKLTSTVNTTAKTVTATVTHFTIFALLGQTAPPPTTVPPTTPPPTTVPPTTPPPTTVPPTTTLPTTSPTTTTPSTGTSNNWLLILGVIAAALVLALVIFQVNRSKKG